MLAAGTVFNQIVLWRVEGSEEATQTGSEVTRTGSEVTKTGSEVTRTGSEVTRTGSEVTKTGSEVTRTGSEVTRTGSEVTKTGPEALVPQTGSVGSNKSCEVAEVMHRLKGHDVSFLSQNNDPFLAS